jgi:CheY-like chemotaxis protein
MTSDANAAPRPRVLIADDYPGMVTAVTRLLALDCDVVGSVADGISLLEAAKRLQPDVIVLDVNLPKIHGLDACRRVLQANPKVKVVVFTAMIDPDIEQQFLDAGASAYLSKTGLADLRDVVRQVGLDSR